MFEHLSTEMIWKIIENLGLEDLVTFGGTNHHNKRVVNAFIETILPTTKGAELVIAQFEKYICSDSKKCLSFGNFIKTAGVVASWKKKVNSDPFKLIAFMLTTENVSDEPSPIGEDGYKALNVRLAEAIKCTKISPAVAASINFSYQVRHYPLWDPDIDLYYNVPYLQKQGRDYLDKFLKELSEVVTGCLGMIPIAVTFVNRLIDNIFDFMHEKRFGERELTTEDKHQQLIGFVTKLINGIKVMSSQEIDTLYQAVNAVPLEDIAKVCEPPDEQILIGSCKI